MSNNNNPNKRRCNDISTDSVPSATAMRRETSTPVVSSSEEGETYVLADPLTKLLHVKMQKDDEHEVGAALKELDSRMGNEDNIKKAFSLGAHSIILLALKKWKDSESIQTNGRDCLAHMLKSNQISNSLGIKKALVQSGSIEDAVWAMKNFRESAGIQERAFLFLDNLFYVQLSDANESAIAKQASAFFVNEVDGIELVVAAMGKFGEDEHVQEYGISLLDELARENDYHKRLMNAVGVVGAALTNFKEHNVIQEEGVSFMRKMFSEV